MFIHGIKRCFKSLQVEGRSFHPLNDCSRRGVLAEQPGSNFESFYFSLGSPKLPLFRP